MTPLSHWVGFHAALVVLLAAEWGMARLVRGARARAIIATVMWVVASLAFAGWLVRDYHAVGATQYLAGYALEEALSIDNLFVFLLLFGMFRIPENRQQKVLFWGVTGAMVMRGAFVAGGIGLLTRFHWVEYIFAAVLLVAAVRLMLPGNEQQETSTPRWIAWLARVRPISESHEHFFVKEEVAGRERWLATVLLLALVAVELTDVVFALDSIPAVLSITRVPFLAYTSNIMAVMGLRSLYVLLAAMLKKLRYIHYGLAAVLLFAAVKMLVQDWVEVGPGMSLAVVVVLLGVTIGASVVMRERNEDEGKGIL